MSGAKCIRLVNMGSISTRVTYRRMPASRTFLHSFFLFYFQLNYECMASFIVYFCVFDSVCPLFQFDVEAVAFEVSKAVKLRNLYQSMFCIKFIA